MHISESKQKREYENLLPLVNVVFLLLIFFMVAGAFSSPEIFDISPPVATNDFTADNKMLTIIMNKEGDLAIDNQQISLQSLTAFVDDYLASETAYKVQLKVDAEAQALNVVAILEKLSASSADAVQILTSSSELNN